MNIDERDSEDPESDEGITTENRNRQVDPKLDAKIRAIRQGVNLSAGKATSSSHIASQGTYGTQVDSRPGAHGSKSSQNVPTTADD